MTALAGTLVSSLHRLKDSDNNMESAFFVFGDLSVKLEGKFALQFNLYEIRDTECFYIHSVLSQEFSVHGAKHFPGLSESTPLTRSFSEQGVRLRVRKEPRTLLRKRGPASDNYVPRSYNRQRLHLETSEDQFGETEDSPESSRHSQAAEHQGSMQSPLEGPQGRQMEIARAYSNPSYSEDTSLRHSMTGAGPEQSQQSAFAHQSQQLTYGQQRPLSLVTPLESPNPDSRSKNSDYTHSSYGSYTQHSPQQMYGYQYAQSHSAVTRDDYFDTRVNTQQEVASPSYQQTAPTNFLAQPQAQYNQMPGYDVQLSPSPSMHGMPGLYGSIAISDPSRHSGVGEAEMAPPPYSRTSSTPGYASMMGDMGDRRNFIVPGTGYGTIQNIFTSGMRVTYREATARR